MSDGRVCAVLTGDIVLSKRFTEKGPAISITIREAYRAAEDAFEDTLVGLDVFRGDSWQMLLRAPNKALRIALLMRALIRSRKDLPHADTRIAIGLGELAFVDHQNISESQGEAFTLSGQALERLTGGDVRLAAALPGSLAPQGTQLLSPQETLDTVMTLLDTICAGWTAAKAETVAGALRGWKQERIADERGVAQSTISRVLSSANWTAICQAVEWWERAVTFTNTVSKKDDLPDVAD
ncbi:MAG: hypothetical protein GX131_06590 [candidate division WS1 bacterium]|jgi:hypothetical protein|nr:hypothetical protein [candidate division WS1 bacterium]